MALVILATLASYAVAWLIKMPLLVPFLNAAVPWWMMARELRRGRTTRAVGVMLLWAATMGAASTWMAYRMPDTTRALFLRSEYRDEMIAWVRTGVGDESTPAVFVPRHLGYAAVFVTASAATGGILSMPMGAALMNQMGDYVGGMAAQSAHPLASAVLGWCPWAVVRIIGFVILGVVLSGVLLSRLFHFSFALRDHRRWLVVACALLVLDIAMKWVLAPQWAPLLRGMAGW